jgi:hypothetical protein
MNDFTLPHGDLPSEIETLVFIAWVQRFATDRLNIAQTGFGSTATGLQSFTFGDPTGDHFQLELSLGGTWSLKDGRTVAEDAVQNIVTDAKTKLVEKDFGEDVAYKTALEAKSFVDDIFSGGPHFMRQLGDQTPITGRRRLSDRVLLDFKMDVPEDPSVPILFVPKTTIDVVIFVPGPIHSEFSRQMAFGFAEIVSALCALALGHTVDGPVMVFPLPDEEVAAALADRPDTSVGDH